jgi:hypothetical protein
MCTVDGLESCESEAEEVWNCAGDGKDIGEGDGDGDMDNADGNVLLLRA